jgi:hypothetical protein
MLTLLNLNGREEHGAHNGTLSHLAIGAKRDLLRQHYHKRRKQAHRIRLILETISTVFVAIETKLLLFGVLSIIWMLVDATMLIADDYD